MMKAKSQILMIGWDFDTRVALDAAEDDAAPTGLGAFISYLPKKNPALQIHILNWDMGALQLLFRGTTALRIVRWARTKNIHFKLDGAHPTGGSHHHKILVIDDQVAFCGGIDITAERWDTRGHLDDDPGRKRPTTHRPYGPWHDATMALEGDVAQALGDLARKRWVLAGGTPIVKPDDCGDPWPEELEPMFQEVDVAVSRTRAAHAGRRPVREIEALFVDQIQRAKRFVYAENQYFASRRIAQAIAERLAHPDCPEFVLVNPATGRGWLDEEAMSPARTQLLEMIQKADLHGRFRIYTPVTRAGEDIYVHAKITIIDGQILRVGSANLNNRSMGLDSECDVTIDSALSSNRSTTGIIPAILHDLLAEHLAVEPSAIATQMKDCGSLIRTIESFRTEGRSLRPLELRDMNRLERALAKKETFDPESGGEQFEPIARPGLLAGLHRASRFGASLRRRKGG